MIKSRNPVDTTTTHHHLAHYHHVTHHASHSAPIGVMGDHMLVTGEWMFSLRQMRMKMSGNKIGSDNASDTEILTIPNTNAMMPPNLRVVPQHMEMDMTMLGVMYALNTDLTLMAMAEYVQKTMRLTTYNMMGMRLGDFETKSEGLGDLTITALIRGQKTTTSQIHYALGLSLPTGDIKEKDTLLTPMNTRIVARLPYAMQTGSGSYDLKPALTLNKHNENYNFGGQVSAVIRLNDNDADYRQGNMFSVQSWVSKSLSPSVSTSLRLKGTSEEKIEGRDALINKPIQSANPNFYGGERLSLGIGLNLSPQSELLAGKGLNFEIIGPIYENLNGPQMSQDWSLTVGFKTNL
ncbi:MAG: transporter [Candidatus Micropelagos thuwalensis]